MKRKFHYCIYALLALHLPLCAAEFNSFTTVPFTLLLVVLFITYQSVSLGQFIIYIRCLQYTSFHMCRIRKTLLLLEFIHTDLFRRLFLLVRYRPLVPCRSNRRCLLLNSPHFSRSSFSTCCTKSLYIRLPYGS